MLLPACWMDVISNLICDESLFHAKMYKIFADILICSSSARLREKNETVLYQGRFVLVGGNNLRAIVDELNRAHLLINIEINTTKLN